MPDIGPEREGGAAPERELDDGGVVRRIMCGDGRAEAELCRRFAGRIRRYGLRHLGSEAAAADLVQHVLVVVLQRLRSGQVRDPDRVGSYVLGACRLAVRDTRRERARHEDQLARYAADLGPSAPAIEDPGGLDRARLEACLQALAERERAVVLMTFHGGLGADEIGDELGATAGHVRVIRHRAIARLRGCMGAGDAT